MPFWGRPLIRLMCPLPSDMHYWENKHKLWNQKEQGLSSSSSTYLEKLFYSSEPSFFIFGNGLVSVGYTVFRIQRQNKKKKTA